MFHLYRWKQRMAASCFPAAVEAIGHRHRGFGGGRGGPLGGGFGGDPFGEGGFRFGRRMGADHLHLLLLALLAERPRHGYETIKALEERSGGLYRPSPGSIYPALTYLEEVGYALGAAEGAKKLYSITAAGTAYLTQNRAEADAILAELDRIGRRMNQVRRFFGAGLGSEGAPAEAGPGETADEEVFGSDDLRAARRELKQALAGSRDGTPEDQMRVAQILRRAARAIRGEEETEG